RGRKGQEYVEVNAYGKRMGAIDDMPNRDPVPGHDVTLTIDSRLQLVAEEAFADTLCGAVVALDPRTGEVLVMLSQPSVDANIFSQASSLRSKGWQGIVTDPSRPLNNRATTGIYTPGSTFKLVSALAGLGSGRITPSSTMPRACTGVYYIGRMPKHCWYWKGHGHVNVAEAIQVSCNVYFYQLGLMLGDSLINHYARELGLGKLTGIDLPRETDGWLSGEKLYNERHANRGWTWTDGLNCDHAIGQTQSMTPLQLARMAATIATGGPLLRPHLLKEVRTHNGVVVEQQLPEILAELDLDSAALAAVREGMVRVLGPGGTAGRARVEGVAVGGKTGSAEWKKGEKTHGLFVGCAPMDDPQIAIAVVVENAGHGGSVAAPIAGKVFNYYFNEIVQPDVIADADSATSGSSRAEG
ncbi:MAG: penicillin-binding protein 2, partial [Chitinivibrionales bacterium]|nr:penicillin-binding protein 2 [Chitinivibrionales bacterium]